MVRPENPSIRGARLFGTALSRFTAERGRERLVSRFSSGSGPAFIYQMPRPSTEEGKFYNSPVPIDSCPTKIN